MLRLSRGQRLIYEINQAELSGRDPLPAYAKKTTIRFPKERLIEKKDRKAYALVDRDGKEDEFEVKIQERQHDQL